MGAGYLGTIAALVLILPHIITQHNHQDVTAILTSSNNLSVFSMTYYTTKLTLLHISALCVCLTSESELNWLYWIVWLDLIDSIEFVDFVDWVYSVD